MLYPGCFFSFSSVISLEISSLTTEFIAVNKTFTSTSKFSFSVYHTCYVFPCLLVYDLNCLFAYWLLPLLDCSVSTGTLSSIKCLAIWAHNKYLLIEEWINKLVKWVFAFHCHKKNLGQGAGRRSEGGVRNAWQRKNSLGNNLTLKLR